MKKIEHELSLTISIFMNTCHDLFARLVSRPLSGGNAYRTLSAAGTCSWWEEGHNAQEAVSDWVVHHTRWSCHWLRFKYAQCDSLDFDQLFGAGVLNSQFLLFNALAQSTISFQILLKICFIHDELRTSECKVVSLPSLEGADFGLASRTDELMCQSRLLYLARKNHPKS
jgi:hypothetical protein